MQEMTRLMLGLAKIPKPDDTADALAMAICHGHCSGSMMGKQFTEIKGFVMIYNLRASLLLVILVL